jgi:Polyketide cyclase / dehydrase and lipid transport
VIRVYTSSVIDAPADTVWAAIRDFNSLPAWHPLIAESKIENGLASDKVGCVRAFRMRDGGQLREQLLSVQLFNPRVADADRELCGDLEAHPGDRWQP